MATFVERTLLSTTHFYSFDLQGNETLATIENVFAVIEGREEPDR
jgi:hypothetical protein